MDMSILWLLCAKFWYVSSKTVVYHGIVKLRLKFGSSGSARITCLPLNQTTPCFVLFCFLYFVFDPYILCFLCFSCLHLIPPPLINLFKDSAKCCCCRLRSSATSLYSQKIWMFVKVFIFSRQKLLVLVLLWGFVTIWNGFYNEVLGECAASSGWKCVGPTKPTTSLTRGKICAMYLAR